MAREIEVFDPVVHHQGWDNFGYDAVGRIRRELEMFESPWRCAAST